MKTYSKPSRKYAKRRRHFKQYRDNRAPKRIELESLSNQCQQLRGNR